MERHCDEIQRDVAHGNVDGVEKAEREHYVVPSFAEFCRFKGSRCVEKVAANGRKEIVDTRQGPRIFEIEELHGSLCFQPRNPEERTH